MANERVRRPTNPARASSPHTPAEGAPPLPRTRFIGREGELAAIAPRLTAGSLVTILGPPGVGKTRLALELARRQAAPAAAVLFCDLSAVTDADGICAVVGE